MLSKSIILSPYVTRPQTHRPVSPVPSCVSMKSDRSMGHPLNFSSGPPQSDPKWVVSYSNWHFTNTHMYMTGELFVHLCVFVDAFECVHVSVRGSAYEWRTHSVAWCFWMCSCVSLPSGSLTWKSCFLSCGFFSSSKNWETAKTWPSSIRALHMSLFFLIAQKDYYYSHRCASFAQ